MTTHPYLVRRDPRGRRVEIDTSMAPLIEALWDTGFTTIGCCQDLGESIGELNARKARYWKGWALLEMPHADAVRFSDVAIASQRFPLHWAADGAWEIQTPMIQLPDGAFTADLVQIHFPVSQIGTLTEVIRELKGQP